MKVTLINPPSIGQIGEFLSYVTYPPSPLLYVAAALRAGGVEVNVVDCFGESPFVPGKFTENTEMIGLWGDDLFARVESHADLIGITCLSFRQSRVVRSLIGELKKRFGSPVVIGGQHATVAFPEFLEAGADFVIQGEGEIACLRLAESLGNPEALASIPGLKGQGFSGPEFELIKDLDSIPFPAYDLIPLDTYWNYGDAQAPQMGRYLDMFTSRGCPYSCNFCASTKVSKRVWRPRSPENVVAEMEHFNRTIGVAEFHIQDPNFSTSRKRMKAIAERIMEKGLSVKYSLPMGVKGDNFLPEDLEILARSGLHYMILSPESGSPKVLKSMNKVVNQKRLLELISKAYQLGIHTACVFLLGYPGEDDEDRKKTVDLAMDFIKRGLDEFTVYIYLPVPGCKNAEETPITDYEKINSYPTWREDYQVLASTRKRIFALGLAYKLAYHPLKSLKNVWNTLIGVSEIKGEMMIRRAIRIKIRKLMGRMKG